MNTTLRWTTEQRAWRYDHQLAVSVAITENVAICGGTIDADDQGKQGPHINLSKARVKFSHGRQESTHELQCLECLLGANDINLARTQMPVKRRGLLWAIWVSSKLLFVPTTEKSKKASEI